MKKIINLILGILLLTVNISAQPGVGPAPYCMPMYSQIPCNQPNPSNTPGNSINDFIHSFTTAGAITNINNLNTGCNAQNLSGIKNYFYWGCTDYLVTAPGQVITCSYLSGNVYAQGFAVFVDWNQDNIFQVPAERVTGTPGVPPAATWSSSNFMVPLAQPNGIYRMRVRCAYFTNGTTIDPCNNYTYGETHDYNLYIGTAPVGVITATLGSNSPICTGNTLNLTATASGTAAPSYTYTWSGPNSFTSSVMNPTISATTSLQSGVYTVTINPGGCPITKTIQVAVNATPTITSITNNGPICQGSNLIFNTNIISSGTVSYLWNGPNGYTSIIQNPTIAGSTTLNTGTYNFTVTNTFANNATCKATGISTVVVVPVNGITVTPTFTLCQGSNLNLTANVLGASSYSWTGPNSFTSNVQNPIINGVNPVNSGNYNFTAFFTAPGTTLVCNSTAVSNLSVVAMNPVSIFATNNVCQNSTATFSANAAGNPSYYWTGPNSYTSNSQSNNINNILPISSGAYSVNAIFSLGTVSCITSNATVINVISTNTIAVTPSITVCNGQSAQLNAFANGAVSYTWSGPGGYSVSAPNTQFINLTPSWSGTYTITAAFTNGNLTCYTTNSTVLTVKPDIQFTLNPIGKLCFNQNLLVNGPSGATSYTWTGPNFTSNIQNLSIPNASTVNIGTYNLVVDLNGCKTYGSIFIDVQNPIEWKTTPNNITICKNDTYTLVAQADLGSGNYAYNWNPSAGLTGPTGSVQVGTGTGTTIYNVTAYDIACPQYTINHSFTVTVNKAPVPNLNLNNNQCEPFCSIYDSQVGTNGIVNYSFNGIKDYYGDKSNICLSAGEYTLDITTIGNNGCKEVFRYPYTIVVYPKPNADFTWDPSSPNSLTESFVTFSPVGQILPISGWFWDFYGQSTSSLMSPTHQFNEQNNYAVTLMVTTDHGCRDTITKVVSVKDEYILYVPNAFTPNGDGLNDIFGAKGLGIKKFEMMIFDRWGNQIFQSGDIQKGWDGTVRGVLVQDDVYVYKITAIDNNSIRHELTGHVTLIK